MDDEHDALQPLEPEVSGEPPTLERPVARPGVDHTRLARVDT